MNKITSLWQLQEEKQRIKQRQEMLEKKIQHNWRGLTQTLQPGGIVAGLVNAVLKDKTAALAGSGNVIRNSFVYGATLLARQLADKAGNLLQEKLSNNNRC